MTVKGFLLGRLINGMGTISARTPQDRRNALTLQAMLAITGTVALAMAAVSYSTAGSAGPGEGWEALAIGAYAWFCFYLVRRGLFRLSSALAVIGGMIPIGLSYQAYGLQAQSGLQMTHLLPLLFAGLMLGRAAAWWTAVASVVALLIGAHADTRLATNAVAAAEIMPNLILSVLNLLVLTVFLDRLILSSQRANERSEKLNATCLELEHEIREKELAHARLLQTQRMETIGRLSTGVAHDFNNILSVILGLATSADMRGGSVDSILPGIRQAARRGAMATRRLLSFSRTQAKQVSTFDLAEAVDEVRSLIVPMFPRRIQVRFNVSAPGLLVRSDRDELELVLLNIASNACDAMPDGGQFTLSVMPDGDHALIRMEDTGIGMAPDVRDRLFEPFFTTKPKGKGTGIGMAVTHRFVVDSGGGIDVDSTPGRGTRISIRLPMAAVEDGQRHDRDSESLRVLLVTASPEVSHLVAATLCAHGHLVSSATHGNEALSLLLQSSAIDAVIADQQASGTDGLALLMQMRDLLPKARRILLCDRLGDDLYNSDILRLPKPFTGKQLLATLADLPDDLLRFQEPRDRGGNIGRPAHDAVREASVSSNPS